MMWPFRNLVDIISPIPLRLAIGVIFAVHGYEKVFETGTGAVSENFAQMGIMLPQITGPLVSLTEFLGGIFLIVGLLTPLSSLMLAVTMAVAVFHVHWPNGLTGQGGYEYPLSLLAGTLTLFFLGAGPLSLDRFLFRGHSH